ncbi:hypothetical protein [Arthrobacter sp. UYEF20]|uniref:hypothetical protein n=1 Tax=Arthrobacter sp. UYEF20 TaxID=1756363 RepID=UPI00339281A1
MPTTRNVAWDERLAAFKGRDTTHFVTLAADLAAECAACGLALQPDELLSLIVDITDGTDADGFEYQSFDTCICHRRCREPGVSLHRAAGGPDELAVIGARFTLGPRVRARTIPVLAFTLVPVLTFREPGGELTSALVSVLLTHGFRLSLGTGYDEIVDQVREVGPGVDCTVAESGLVILSIDGGHMYSHQMDRRDAGDAEWLDAAARKGKVLVISGDYLEITDTGLNLDPAARLGTLATGHVPVLTA